jgi:hypothetical protein
MNNRDQTKQKVLRKRFKAAIKKNKGAVTAEAKHAGAEAQRKLALLDAPSAAPERAAPEKAEKATPAARTRAPKPAAVAAAADTAAEQPPAA